MDEELSHRIESEEDPLQKSRYGDQRSRLFLILIFDGIKIAGWRIS